MTSLRSYLWPSWVVLVAIVGMLSVTSEAVAGNACPCCAGRGCQMGCCGRPGTQSGPGAVVPPAAITPMPDRATMFTAPPCACRPEEPAEPAAEPETSPSERYHAGPAGSQLEASRPVVFAPVIKPAPGRSLAPLLLDTTRLLI